MNYKELLNNIKEDTIIEENYDAHQRVLIIDGLNLFFRNFAVMNMVNSYGDHIGGLGGFLRSLGSLIGQINPTSVYVVFDGVGSSQNRKNIIPEYKSNRNITKITNWEIFNNIEEENDSKIDQIGRIIQYLSLLPVKIISINKTEADDVIAVISEKLSKNKNNQIFMVTNDKDYFQLIKKNVILYMPSKKDFITSDFIFNEYKVLVENFIIYKTLIGDNSDKVKGAKGLGPKKIVKLFPMLSERVVTLENLFKFCEEKINDNVIYAQILKQKDSLRNSYKIMDLSNPMVGEEDIEYIENFIKTEKNKYQPLMFNKLYEEDQLGKIIKNLDKWLKDYFEPLLKFHII